MQADGKILVAGNVILGSYHQFCVNRYNADGTVDTSFGTGGQATTAIGTVDAYAYGLAAAGEVGVDRAIEILRTDLERTLRLLGCPSVAELDRSYVNVPKCWESN